MSTMNLKWIARNIANATTIDYEMAYKQVSDAINNLGIERLSFNELVLDWEISAFDADMLIEMLTDRNNESE